LIRLDVQSGIAGIDNIVEYVIGLAGTIEHALEPYSFEKLGLAGIDTEEVLHRIFIELAETDLFSDDTILDAIERWEGRCVGKEVG
jgi:hypothetical protein